MSKCMNALAGDMYTKMCPQLRSIDAELGNQMTDIDDVTKLNGELEAEIVRLRIWIDDPCPDCKYETEEPCDANSPCLCCKFNQPYVSNFKEKGSSPDCEKVG